MHWAEINNNVLNFETYNIFIDELHVIKQTALHPQANVGVSERLGWCEFFTRLCNERASKILRTHTRFH